LLEKTPEVLEKERNLDISDVLADPVVQFEIKYYWLLRIMFSVVLPMAIPVYFWDESPLLAFNTWVMLRNVIVLNIIWSVGSLAHVFGMRPYHEGITPTENLFVSLTALGEGWHNYHHIFPWDYKASEFGPGKYNFTTIVLKIFAKFGWIYDTKEASLELIRSTALKHGDGSFTEVGYDENMNQKYEKEM
jgi:stearoyl-CoA desaturase (delta-9 desaturase)